MRNEMQYNPWPNRRNFRVFEEIGIEENNCDVSKSSNMAVSCLRKASGHSYRNSSFILDLAMGQIPHSTGRISSLHIERRVVVMNFTYRIRVSVVEAQCVDRHRFIYY